MNPKDIDINPKLLAPYNPAETEDHIYKMWEESGFFNPDICVEKGVTKPDAEPFTIMMPPPNATGTLHMGHAMFITVEDILTRFKRMQGYKTLWLPGTDHASIATQSRVEKEIYKKEGKSRYDLGREELLNRIDKFVEENRSTMTSQMRTMGASCDWSREAFTLDEKRNLAVNTIFKKMYDDGLIYRGNKIINWDPKGQTTISDDEIVYEERKSKMYTFKYSHDFPIAISTTRPETKVGDVAVAVNPTDERYKDYIGQSYIINDFCGVKLEIKIIADEAVEKDFGTGALGVTPAHSIIDWEIADRHDLPRPQVINEHAKMMIGGENLLGKKTTEAREIVVNWLKEQNLLEQEEEVNQNISTAERTGGIVEPLPKLQWFVDVNKIIPGRGKSLKDIMREPMENGDIKIVPDYFNKTYFHWIDNLRDWCISRQIWYGHRIPVWYKKDTISEFYVDINPPENIEFYEQDPDTLDTWFSSALWTFSTLGWPEQTEDLKIYHPTDVLDTASEILFFWVARMILMTGYALDQIPFKTVYIHGTVRDAKGQKMSKSLGNGLDPVDIAQKFGADAGRMALIVGTAPGTDSKIDENKIKGYKHFANKIWNIARFVETNTKDLDMSVELTETDKAIYQDWKNEAQKITNNIKNYQIHLASDSIYHYIWDTFAAIIIEESKSLLNSDDEQIKKSQMKLLHLLLTETITVLHPFMPFVTEEIWQIIKKDNELPLIVSPWVTLG